MFRVVASEVRGGLCLASEMRHGGKTDASSRLDEGPRALVGGGHVSYTLISDLSTVEHVTVLIELGKKALGCDGVGLGRYRLY